jgi:hypothetical protein
MKSDLLRYGFASEPGLIQMESPDPGPEDLRLGGNGETRTHER